MGEDVRVVVQGVGPGPRYGHVMSLVGQRFLLSIGGNDGEFYFQRPWHSLIDSRYICARILRRNYFCR